MACGLAEPQAEVKKPNCFDHMSFDHVSFARSVLHAQDEELERLRKIEAAAVACSEHPVWNDDQFYGLMTELQRALRGEVGADKTANAKVSGGGAFPPSA